MLFFPTPIDFIVAPVLFVAVPVILLCDELSVNNLFVRPNILMWNRPEVFTFITRDIAFVVESGAAGIHGHAHKLVPVKNPAKKCNGALTYFTLDSEYLHSHPDTSTVYYIAKNGSEYAIFDSNTESIVFKSAFTAGHYHSLKIREVIPLVAGV